MLAAHRNGGRTSLASFARAWDRYTGARGASAAGHRARAHTPSRRCSRRASPWTSCRRSRTWPRRGARRLGLAASVPPLRRVRARGGRARRDQSSESPGPDELELRHHAVARSPQQEADRLGDVLRLDHLVLRNLALDPVGHAAWRRSRGTGRSPGRRPWPAPCAAPGSARRRRTSWPSRPTASPGRACRRIEAVLTISALPCSAPASLSMGIASRASQVDRAQVHVELEVELLGLQRRRPRRRSRCPRCSRARRAGRSARGALATSFLISSSSAMLAGTASHVEALVAQLPAPPPRACPAAGPRWSRRSRPRPSARAIASPIPLDPPVISAARSI